MIKLNASYSKKVPAEQEYSSKSFMACVEVELPTGVSAAELRSKIHDTFELVKQSVEDEIAGRSSNQRGHHPNPSRGHQKPSDNKASNKQISFLLDLAKARKKTLPQLNAEVEELFGVESIYMLDRKSCSQMIEQLQQRAA